MTEKQAVRLSTGVVRFWNSTISFDLLRFQSHVTNVWSFTRVSTLMIVQRGTLYESLLAASVRASTEIKNGYV